jgi:hypothetical protein
MKVYIGKYTSWVGPYQIASALCFWAKKQKDEFGISREADWVHDFGTWLAEKKDGSDTWLTVLCNWVQSKKERTIKVRIDRWDTWSMDHTLSLLALPMLKQLQETKHGSAMVDDEDVPEYLRSTAPGARDNCENEWDTDDNLHLRWDWVLAEMIHAHNSKVDDTWEDKYWTGEWGELKWKKSDVEFPNPLTGKMESTYEMEKTGTRECDWEGLKKEQDRIQNGFRLFGKYYQNLWD